MSKRITRSKLISNLKKCKDALSKMENSFPAPTKRELHDLKEAVYHAKLDLANFLADLTPPPAKK